MAALELHDTDGPVLRENIYKAIDGLELPHQKVQQMLSDYMWHCRRSLCDDQYTSYKLSGSSLFFPNILSSLLNL